MNTSVVHKPVFALITCVLFFMSALPLVALSQVETSSTTPDAADVNEMSAGETAASVANHPYKTEKLLGDKEIGDFVLAPGKVEVELNPGESKTVLLTVSNRIGEPHTFSLDIEDIDGSGSVESPVVLLGDDTGPYTLKDYISIPQREFELPHNVRATVPVTISIPEDAEPGGRYGSVLVKTVTSEASPGINGAAPRSAVVSRIGALFFVRVPGDVAEEAQMKAFETIPPKKWYDKGPINFGITFENTGSVHLNPYGEIRITNMFGEEVGFVELEPWFVLPKSVRLREVIWNRDFMYGRYTATASINRGYDDVVDELSYTFWVIPWKVVVGIFAVVFVVLFLIRAFFRTFEFKRKDNDSE